MNSTPFKYKNSIQKRTHFEEYPIHIWHIQLNDSNFSLLSTSLLSGMELQRAERIRVSKSRNQYVKTRSTLREILGMYLDRRPKKIEFSYTKYCKPFVQLNPEKIEFNISHSSTYALCVISQKRLVGIDIEKIRPLDDLDQIAKNIFASDELSTYIGTPTDKKLAYFYRAWSRKEAFVKAQGKGLFHPINQLDLARFSSKGQSTVLLPDIAGNKCHWTFNDFSISDAKKSYQACVCWKGESLRIRHFQAKDIIGHERL